jgi:DNA-binding transcriptional LysR family regulator
MAPPLTEAVRARLPQVGFTILSQSSEAIRRALEEFTIDLGLTYLDNEPVEPALTRPLYRERYRLFVRRDHPLAGRDAVGWAEAADHPLGLLTPDMQNRRIVDAAFRKAGVRPAPEIESNSAFNLCAYVLIAGLASVLPEFFVGMVAESDIRAIPLVEPEVEHSVGLVALDRDPLPRLVAAAFEAAKGYRPPAALMARL